VLHFKLRVLDLVDVLLKNCMGNPIAIQVIKPIIELYKTTSGVEDLKVLHQKIAGLIQNRYSSAKDTPAIDNAEESLDILQKIHDHCSKAADLKTYNMYSTIALFLIKTITKVQIEVPAPAKKKSKKELTKVFQF
jgi:DNA polymerase phi